MPVIRNVHNPTHVLAVSLANPNAAVLSLPTMTPIQAGLYNIGFKVEILPQGSIDAVPPVPFRSSVNPWHTVSLPVVALTVPHTDSFPLLLLFGLGLEKQLNLLASRLLPVEAIEEFPNAAAMAQVMSKLSVEQFEDYFSYNRGLWQNVLCVGLQDMQVVDLIRTAWNVTAEGRKIRHRRG